MGVSRRFNRQRRLASRWAEIGFSAKGIIAAAALGLSPGYALAAGQNGPFIAATNSGVVGAPVLRTPEDRARDAGLLPTHPRVPGVVINAPTISLDEYNSLKATMASMPASEKLAPANFKRTLHLGQRC